jgi:GMP synthase (glutamine-hydrolysing)
LTPTGFNTCIREAGDGRRKRRRRTMDAKVLILKHAEDEGPGLLGDLFRAEGWEIEVIALHKGEPVPTHLDGYGALIILGGPMNVHEEDAYPFLREEGRLIMKALIEEVPLLGICLGAQLLAKTCGGAVYRAPQREFGWYRILLAGDASKDVLFRGLPKHMSVFQWHEDTFEIPEGGVLLAEGRGCRNQAFRMGNCAYGLQFHLETTDDMVKAWLAATGAVGAKRIMRDTIKMKECFEEQANQFFLNFKRMIESSLRIKKVMKIFIEDEREAKKRRSVLWWDVKARTLVAAGA